MKITGHLEAVRWLLRARPYQASPGNLALGDWVRNPHIWMHYVESADGAPPEDDVLRSTYTRHWSIDDVQRYCPLSLHCEEVLFTYQYPNLRMPSHLGGQFWSFNTSLKLPNRRYLKEFHISLETTLKKMQVEEVQIDRLIISDQLIKLNCLDYFRRQSFFRMLNNILSFQDRLQLVSLENLCCSRLEGTRLLQQLACFNAQSLKYLYLWRFVLPNENPILVNYSYINECVRSNERVLHLCADCLCVFTSSPSSFGRRFVRNDTAKASPVCSGQYIPRHPSRRCFLRSLGELRNLRILALEYSHLADATGGALVSLIVVLKRPHMRLQLMCREHQIPGRADPALGVGGYVIPDSAWRRVANTCPDLYLLMAFCLVRDYDNIRRFLTPSIPLREAHIELGVDLKQTQRQDSDVTCVVRHLSYHYASTLVALSIHQWRFAVFPLRRVFELMPRLARFFYVGRVWDEVDLRRMLQIVACGVCDKLKYLKILIQDEEAKRNYWKTVVANVIEEYQDIMKLYDIKFDIKVYKT